MADFPTTARVVIIGGGAIGASSLYHLALKGWTDCVLLEKNELTSGSTWHAAGNVPTFSASWSIMNMQRYSTELYRGLAEAVDYPMNYHVTGSIRLAHSKERMQEFERAVGMGRYQGMDMEMCSQNDLKARYPFLETHDLTGGLYDPYDGDIDPSQLTQALAKGARDLGAKIIRFCPMTGVRREGGEWVVETPKGEVRCEYVVNAAGYRAREVGKMFGREVPMVSMSHQYLLTDEIPELAAWMAESGKKLPLLRDVDSSYYLRQEKTGLNLGPYESNCRAHWVAQDDPMPDDFSFQLYPDDLERLEWHIEDRASTKLGEQRLPYDVVFILNQFFAEMAEALRATGGHYAQFSGDGLMALYGLESDMARGCRDAIRGAAAMAKRLEALNHRLEGELPEPLRIGIGIHCGEAIVGTMGPPSSPNLSAIGDNINIAARLEALCKTYGVTLVVSEDAAQHASVDLSPFDKHAAAVRGREEPVVVYAVPDPLTIGELTAIKPRRDGNSEQAIV